MCCHQLTAARQPCQLIFWAGFWRELEKFKNFTRDVGRRWRRESESAAYKSHQASAKVRHKKYQFLNWVDEKYFSVAEQQRHIKCLEDKSRHNGRLSCSSITVSVMITPLDLRNCAIVCLCLQFIFKVFPSFLFQFLSKTSKQGLVQMHCSTQTKTTIFSVIFK